MKMERINLKKAKQVLEKGAKRVSEEDLSTILDKENEIKDKFKGDGPLSRFYEDLKLLLSLAKDFYKGKYRKIPWWSIASIVSALLYVLNPFDIILDFIPGIGLVDDAMVIAICLNMIEQDLFKYKEWRLKL